MTIKKSVDLSRLKTSRNGEILWAESIGRMIPFTFGEHSGELEICRFNEKKHQVEVRFGEFKTWLGVTKIHYCNLEKLFKTTTKQYLYDVGQVVNGLQITEQIWLGTDRGYAYKCTVCGHEGTVIQTKLKNGASCSQWQKHKRMCSELEGENDV